MNIYLYTVDIYNSNECHCIKNELIPHYYFFVDFYSFVGNSQH